MAQNVKSAFANVVASSTDSVIVAADSSKRAIKVVSVAFVAGGTATNATFNSLGSSSTAISCLFANGANGGAILPFNYDGWFVTNPGEALTITTGTGSTTGVLVNFLFV